MASLNYEIPIDSLDVRDAMDILATIYRSSACPEHIKRRIERLGGPGSVDVEWTGGTILMTAAPEMLAIIAVGRALRIC